MSEVSYRNILHSKNWACPSCVPPFKRMTIVLENRNCVNHDKLMRKLAKVLNPLRSQCADMFYAAKEFEFKYDLCINTFEN